MEGRDSAVFTSKQLPSLSLALLQSHWLEGARSRLLRQAKVHRAQAILDLACGWGQVSLELARRCSGQIIGIDRLPDATEYARSRVPTELQARVTFETADVANLPLASGSQDIVFIQCGMLWMERRACALRECRRVLKPHGALVMIEPDYDGLMEYPPEIAARDLWCHCVSQAGGLPCVGRQLPALCNANGLSCHAYFLDRYQPPDPAYLGFLKELLSAQSQVERVQQIEQLWQQQKQAQIVVHLPFWLVIAHPA